MRGTEKVLGGGWGRVQEVVICAWYILGRILRVASFELDLERHEKDVEREGIPERDAEREKFPR